MHTVLPMLHAGHIKTEQQSRGIMTLLNAALDHRADNHKNNDFSLASVKHFKCDKYTLHLKSNLKILKGQL